MYGTVFCAAFASFALPFPAPEGGSREEELVGVEAEPALEVSAVEQQEWHVLVFGFKNVIWTIPKHPLQRVSVMESTACTHGVELLGTHGVELLLHLAEHGLMKLVPIYLF